jgi:hypothetical protein
MNRISSSLKPQATMTHFALSAIVVAMSALGVSAQAQNQPYNPLPRDPNTAPLVRGNSNLGTPGRVDNLLSFGAAAAVHRIEVKADKVDIPADGRSLVRITIKLLDDNGRAIPGNIPVLLETNRGRIVAQAEGNTELEGAIDRDKTAVGTQTVANNGELNFELLAPGEPGQAQVRITAGPVQITQVVEFVPDLREMIAVGLIEGIINVRGQRGALLPVRPSDGFEQEMSRWQREFNNGKGATGLRAAYFLKGKISGATLLTSAYDSDKDVRARMFRDIQADEFYPVYGDASIKGFDAQTSGRFFVRVDNRKNYALYGDFNTAEQQNEALQLGRYNRSLTGAQGHWQNERLALNAFASKDNLRQVVDELPGRGLSGPYTTRFPNGVQNTEKVDLIVRDRNAPSVILRTTPQVRLIDYDFEPFSGRILFKSPVPSLDENLNPISIRISYEVEEGGPKYWVGGLEGSIKLGDPKADAGTLGASYAKDQNPLAQYELSGVNAKFKIGEYTSLVAEYAHSKRGDAIQFGSNTLVDVNNQLGVANTATAGAANGQAARVEARHNSERLEARAYGQKAGASFTNISSGTTSGRVEAGGKATYRLRPTVRLIGESVYNENTLQNGKRAGASVSAAWDIVPRFTVEAGLRYAKQVGQGATLASSAFPGSGIDPVSGGQTLSPMGGGYGAGLAGGGLVGGLGGGLGGSLNPGLATDLNTPYDNTSVRLKGTFRPTTTSSVYLEAEQDVQDSKAHAYAVGGDYRFSEIGRLYGRSEWVTGLGGAYGQSGSGHQAATVVGVDAQYMKDGQVFSEYRLRDAIAGRESVAAMGVRNYWPVADGVRLNTTLERIKVLDGPNNPEAKAAGIGIDYTRSKLWKGTARLEWREDTLSTSWLSTLAVARKLSDDWTLLARNYAFKQDFDAGDYNHQDRFQIGFAWRETDTNVWSALGKYEYKIERSHTNLLGDLNANVHIISVDFNYHPRRPVWYAGKVAAKQRNDVLVGVPDSFQAQLLQGRVIYDITNRWDVGLIGSMLMQSSNRRYGVGIELGRVITDNLWLSLGFNFKELKDKDLLTDYSSKGVFLKLRYKFDENLFKGKNTTANRFLAGQP